MDDTIEEINTLVHGELTRTKITDCKQNGGREGASGLEWGTTENKTA